MLASHALMLVGVPFNRVLRRIRETREQRYGLFRGFFRGVTDETGEERDRLQPRLHSVRITPGARGAGAHPARARSGHARRGGDCGTAPAGAQPGARSRHGAGRGRRRGTARDRRGAGAGRDSADAGLARAVDQGPDSPPLRSSIAASAVIDRAFAAQRSSRPTTDNVAAPQLDDPWRDSTRYRARPNPGWCRRNCCRPTPAQPRPLHRARTGTGPRWAAHRRSCGRSPRADLTGIWLPVLMLWRFVVLLL